MIEYIYTGGAVSCPALLESYVRLNYPTIDPKLIYVYSDFTNNRTILYFNTPLTASETSMMDALLPVFTCDLNFTDPNLTNPPDSPTVTDISDSIIHFDFHYRGSVSGTVERWLYTSYISTVPYVANYRMKLLSFVFSNRLRTNVAFKVYKRPAAAWNNNVVVSPIFLRAYHGYVNNLSERNIIIEKGERFFVGAKSLTHQSEIQNYINYYNGILVGTWQGSCSYASRVKVRLYFQILENDNTTGLVNYL